MYDAVIICEAADVPLDNILFPDAFKLANRNPQGLSPKEHKETITNFQIALFESGKRAFNNLQPRVIQAGAVLMRNVKAEFGKTGNQARTVPPNASKNTTVRWSGSIQGTNIARGALYTSLNCKGLLNEAMRYKREAITREVPWKGSATGKATYTFFGPSTRDYQQLLVGRVYYSFKLTQDIKVVDLTPSVFSKFYEAVENDPAYQKVKRDLRVQSDLWRIAFDPVDYTGSRPLGLSILVDRSVDAIQVQTAQTEIPGIPGPGLNVVFGGDDGKQLTFLQPTGKLVVGTSGGHSALLEVSLDGAQSERTVVVPGSILHTGDK
jgi:hypothetical protein